MEGQGGGHQKLLPWQQMEAAARARGGRKDVCVSVCIHQTIMYLKM